MLKFRREQFYKLKTDYHVQQCLRFQYYHLSVQFVFYINIITHLFLLNFHILVWECFFDEA